jgi:hypothetical protein
LGQSGLGFCDAARKHRAIDVLLRSVNMKQALLPPDDLAIAGLGPLGLAVS